MISDSRAGSPGRSGPPPPPGRLLRRASANHLLRQPWQAVLAVLGIALGVAVVVAVDIATESSRRAFELSTAAVFGRATHQILPGPGGLPDSVYSRVRRASPADAAPVVDVRASIGSGVASLPVRILGVDPFAEAPFRPWAEAGSGFDLSSIMTRRGALLIPEELAAELGLGVGDSVRVAVGDSSQPAFAAGVLQPGDALSRRALTGLVLADISTAQELGDRIGRLDRIDLRVAPGDSAALDGIRAVLPPDARIVEADSRAESTLAMTRAFELNLVAFTLITLAFGALLIYDVMTFSVVQRRRLLGLLRALGVTRSDLLRVLLREAVLIGVVATTLGIAIGIALADLLVGLVARTINDLYFSVTVTGVSVGTGTIVRATALGVGATVLASLPAIREATATPPRATLVRSTLEAGARSGSRRAAFAGLLLLVPSVALAFAPGRAVLPGFVALFGVVGAAALLAPMGAVLVMRLVRPVASSLAGAIGSMAVRGVSSTLSRTGPAIAALMVAVAIGAAVGIMVTSFRGSVERWLATSLVADIYVAAPTASRGEGILDPSVIDAVRSVTGVAGISTYRHADLVRDAADVRVVAVRLFDRHREAFTFLDGDPERIWPAFARGELLVSESFGYRNNVGAGDTVHLPTATGNRPFTVAATYRDYASEFGIVFVDRPTWNRFWNDDAVSSIAVFAADGTDIDSLTAHIRRATAGQDLDLRSNRGLRDATLEVFDRTFAITGVLRTLALIVAFVGVLSALMAMQLERVREIGVLRATGLTPRQVGSLITAQTGLLGLAAGALAAPLALALAWLLIHVINRRSFGWTVDMVADPAGMAAAIGIAIAAALLAGIYPAWRMSRIAPAAAVRNE